MDDAKFILLRIGYFLISVNKPWNVECFLGHSSFSFKAILRTSDGREAEM